MPHVYYKTLLNSGVSVVTPNKQGVAGETQLFEYLKDNRKFRYETTVGAALPIVKTVKEFVASGVHNIRKIEGVFSGTLNYVLEQYFAKTEGEPATFASVVRRAQALGVTEPNPYDDLSGMDVARKLLIL